MHRKDDAHGASEFRGSPIGYDYQKPSIEGITIRTNQQQTKTLSRKDSDHIRDAVKNSQMLHENRTSNHDTIKKGPRGK